MSILTSVTVTSRKIHQCNYDCAGAASPINYEYLQRYTLGDRQVDNEILQLFAGQLMHQLQCLQNAADQNDRRAWLEVTHALKGSAQSVGATVLAQCAAEAEQAADNLDRFTTSALEAAIASIIAHVNQAAKETQAVK